MLILDVFPPLEVVICQIWHIFGDFSLNFVFRKVRFNFSQLTFQGDAKVEIAFITISIVTDEMVAWSRDRLMCDKNESLSK